MAVEFSAQLGQASLAEVDRTRSLLTRLNLPIKPPPISMDAFMAAMSVDKKVIGGVIRLILIRSIGGAEVTSQYPHDEMLDLLAQQLGQ